MPKRLPNLIINRVKFDTHDFSDFAKSLTYFCDFTTVSMSKITEKSTSNSRPNSVRKKNDEKQAGNRCQTDPNQVPNSSRMRPATPPAKRPQNRTRQTLSAEPRPPRGLSDRPPIPPNPPWGRPKREPCACASGKIRI